ncbi:MAG: colanic acid biosynthesis glycosyltransferase WcaL [Chloroflexi bacterium]|nr:MAG: colanic acid biosynthesis glycosyltransferase WcaL [Chloroflexota bacterium]
MKLLKMKIVLAVPAFPQLSETFIVSKFLGLLDQGWDVHVVCRRSDKAAWEQFPQLHAALRQRVHVHWQHQPRWLAALLLPLLALRCLWQSPKGCWHYWRQGWQRWGVGVLRRFYLDAELVALQPDLIHFGFGTLAVGSMHLKALLNCKVTVSFRGFDLNQVGLDDPAFYDAVWSHADALHFLGQDLWHRAKRRGANGDTRYCLIPPAIEVDFFDSQNRMHRDTTGTQTRPFRILSVGRLDWKKGIEYALHAIKLLRDQGVYCEYRIVGGGEFLDAVAFARHQMGLETAVTFLGAQPHSQVVQQMRWADAFLHASVSEGFCNAVLEAQATKLPVVCSDAGGLPENVVDGETGFVVPRRNAPALADKLMQLAVNPKLREQMGTAGQSRVQTHFRLEGQISSFERFFRQVMASNAN